MIRLWIFKIHPHAPRFLLGTIALSIVSHGLKSGYRRQETTSPSSPDIRNSKSRESLTIIRTQVKEFTLEPSSQFLDYSQTTIRTCVSISKLPHCRVKPGSVWTIPFRSARWIDICTASVQIRSRVRLYTTGW